MEPFKNDKMTQKLIGGYMTILGKLKTLTSYSYMMTTLLLLEGMKYYGGLIFSSLFGHKPEMNYNFDGM